MSVVYSVPAVTHKYEVFYKRSDEYNFKPDALEVFYYEHEAIEFANAEHRVDPGCAYEVRKTELNVV